MITSLMLQTNGQRDTLLDELKQSRYEVANLVEGKQNLEQKLIDKEGALGHEMSKLTRKLKGIIKVGWGYGALFYCRFRDKLRSLCEFLN